MTTLTTSQFAKRHKLQPSTIQKYCKYGLIPNATKVNNKWQIPDSSPILSKFICNLISYTTKIRIRKIHEACPSCKKRTLEITTTAFSGPYSGRVNCSNCNYTNSVMSHIGKNLVKVEPL